jgi:hypothetical protein
MTLPGNSLSRMVQGLGVNGWRISPALVSVSPVIGTDLHKKVLEYEV